MKSLIVRGGGVALAVLGFASAASADVVYEDLTSTGSLHVFDSSTPAGTRYSDGYWCTPSGSAAVTGLVELQIQLSVTGSPTAGATDLDFVFADGDPSGQQIFGTGTPLYSTTISNVALPASAGGVGTLLLSIPLPNLSLAGGFNDWGFSIGVSNFTYAGSLGFVRTQPPTAVGFSSFLASRYDPVADVWTTFSQGGEVSFAAKLIAVPAPGGVGAGCLMAWGLMTRRRLA